MGFNVALTAWISMFWTEWTMQHWTLFRGRRGSETHNWLQQRCNVRVTAAHHSHQKRDVCWSFCVFVWSWTQFGKTAVLSIGDCSFWLVLRVLGWSRSEIVWADLTTWCCAVVLKIALWLNQCHCGLHCVCCSALWWIVHVESSH